MKGNIAIAKALIDARADLNKANNGNFTPLSMARALGHVDVAEALSDAMRAS